MPRYYFHFRDVDGLDKDHDGFVLPKLADAQIEARRMPYELREVWSGLPPDTLNAVAIEVADETGQTVFIVPFSEAVGQND